MASEKQLAHLARAREEKARIKAEKEAAANVARMAVGPGQMNKLFASLGGLTLEEQVWLQALLTIMRNRNTVNPEGIKACVSFADSVLDAFNERFGK